MGVCVRGGESERGPPCGCAAYMWICGIVCVVVGERERERGGGDGGGGEREKQPFGLVCDIKPHTVRVPMGDKWKALLASNPNAVQATFLKS
jgi:hypothetical protein